MDEFGVLVESIGFKAQGRSAPMADMKSKTKVRSNGSVNFGINSGFGIQPASVNRPKSVSDANIVNGSFDDSLDGIFKSSNNGKVQNNGDFYGFDYVFGGPVKPSKPSRDGGDFDLDSIFKGSSNFGVKSSLYVDDDIFDGMPGLKGSAAIRNDDVFGSMGSPPKKSDQVEDLLGNFSGMGLGSSGLRKKSAEVKNAQEFDNLIPGFGGSSNSRKKSVEVKNAQEFDDLIPGFGGSSNSRNGDNAETSWSSLSNGHSAKSTSPSAEDPFAVLENSSPQSHVSSEWFSEPVDQNAGQRSSLSSVDELEDFAMGKVHNNANKHSPYPQKEKFQTTTHDLDSFFNMGAQPSNGTKHKSKTVDPVLDSLYKSREDPGVEQSSSRNSFSRKKVSPPTKIADDFSFFFGAAPSSGEFQEIEGESEERRRARLNHHMRTQQRMANALAEKNQRDFQVQQEQEERHRIAEIMNDDIKRWAAGKEGNLRALLSSLQYVLWPECGWQPVSLTDLITSVSVKKVYHKATLCVHPDKVQQRGANVGQKYIAEKVFDVLKEAWNKFNSEEL